MEVDVNGDGTIDFDEFKNMMMKRKGDENDQAPDPFEAFKLVIRIRTGSSA